MDAVKTDQQHQQGVWKTNTHGGASCTRVKGMQHDMVGIRRSRVWWKGYINVWICNIWAPCGINPKFPEIISLVESFVRWGYSDWIWNKSTDVCKESYEAWRLLSTICTDWYVWRMVCELYSMWLRYHVQSIHSELQWDDSPKDRHLSKPFPLRYVRIVTCVKCTMHSSFWFSAWLLNPAQPDTDWLFKTNFKNQLRPVF